MKRILFQGKEYVLVADSLDEAGAICTREQYENGTTSFAHYYADDRGIKQFGKKIGERSDIQILGDSDVQMTLGGAINVLLAPEWKEPTT